MQRKARPEKAVQSCGTVRTAAELGALTRGGCYFAFFDFFYFLTALNVVDGGYNTNKGSKRIFGIRPPEPPLYMPSESSRLPFST